jgi:phosphoglycerol transferase MdoB-like AlkP superfamily enzyme
MIQKYTFQFLKLLLFWIVVFDFQRILFTIHNWEKFDNVPFSEIIGAFFHSFRLDLATAGALSILPLLALFLYHIFNNKWSKTLFYLLLTLETVFIALIHSGEINAYGEWNHKLTSRVFMHLGNPDEVFRTADYSMTFWFFVYALIEIAFSWKWMRFLFRFPQSESKLKTIIRIPLAFFLFALFGLTSFLFLRGGFQPIPMNINAAIFSKNPVSNDLSINPLYFFSKSYLLYNRMEIDEFMPKIDSVEARLITEKLLDYPKSHNQYFFKNQRPNLVFVVLESWSADAISSLSETKNSTPNFDSLTKQGVLFSQLYATSGTSEIGNSSIFSGFPGIPEVSISMQPEKHRKIGSINQDLKKVGYSSHYLFSGDLKYGNIGGYFMDHGFDVVKDENDFPSTKKRGKLNFFDADLYDFFIDEINQTKEPFLHCAFTGSTHSPYDHPQTNGHNFDGIEADFMNSIVYADQALGEFINKAKKQPWFDNTVFVFVADHGHATPLNQNPSSSSYNRIPLLFWGKPLKNEFIGKQINKIGSQTDIVATLLYQMGLETKNYPWSKDLMNPFSPAFALHTINRGYGWISPAGNMTYQMQVNLFVEDQFKPKLRKQEIQRCHAYLTEVYRYYKNL